MTFVHDRHRNPVILLSTECYNIQSKYQYWEKYYLKNNVSFRYEKVLFLFSILKILLEISFNYFDKVSKNNLLA
jgi:hypothetical protein